MGLFCQLWKFRLVQPAEWNINPYKTFSEDFYQEGYSQGNQQRRFVPSTKKLVLKANEHIKCTVMMVSPIFFDILQHWKVISINQKIKFHFFNCGNKISSILNSNITEIVLLSTLFIQLLFAFELLAISDKLSNQKCI